MSSGDKAFEKSSLDEHKLWPRYIQVFHWTLMVSIALMYFTDQLVLLHADMGYLILVMVLLRVGIGFIGPVDLRLKNYPLRLQKVVGYFIGVMKWKPPEYPRHNPATAWVSLGFFVVILLLTVSGSITLATTHFEGMWVEPLLFISDKTAQQVKEVHHWLTDIFLLLMFFHVSGALFSCVQHRRNVIRPILWTERRKK